jgi:hypothetical protein
MSTYQVGGLERMQLHLKQTNLVGKDDKYFSTCSIDARKRSNKKKSRLMRTK